MLLPGEPERRARRERAAAIPLDEGTWAELREAATALGVTPPQPLA